MSTAELKSNLHRLIDSISDNKTLNSIYTLLSKQKKQDIDWWGTISKEEKDAIEKGLAEVERGDVVSHEQVMKESFKLLNKYRR